MIAFCFDNWQRSSLASNGLSLAGPHVRDLTYAGYLHGLLGLVGARSRLFFLLLLTIRTMQILAGASSVQIPC